jgi:hypothetical protein
VGSGMVGVVVVVMVVAVTKLPKFENELSAARDIPQPYRLASIHTYTF